MSLLIMRTHSFFTLLYVGGTYARLVYTWYKSIFRMIVVLIVFLALNGEKRNLIKQYQNETVTIQIQDSVAVGDAISRKINTPL